MIHRMWRNNSFVLMTSMHCAAEISVYVFQSMVASVRFYAVVCWERKRQAEGHSPSACCWPLAHSSPWSLDCTSTLSYGRGNKQTDRQTNAFLHLNTLMPIYAKFCTDSFHPFHHGLTFQFVSTGFISQNLNPGTAVLLVLTVSISLFAKVQSNLTFIWQVYF